MLRKLKDFGSVSMCEQGSERRSVGSHVHDLLCEVKPLSRLELAVAIYPAIDSQKQESQSLPANR
jgi:hypothetical protein